jgi:hypothetical protein
MKKQVSTLILASMFPMGSIVHADLVGWWDFEEGSGLTVVDRSGGGHPGTLGTGATWSTTEFAPVPTGSTASISFDGTDLAHVIMNGYKAAEVGGTNSRTLSAWIKSGPGVVLTASNLGIFGYGENAAGDKFNFRTQNQNGPIDGNIRVEVNGGYIIGSAVVIDGEWHHVAMTWEDDGTPNVLDVLLYVDGVLEIISASLDEPIHTDTVNGIDLAISDDHGNREWNGWLDEIRIYDEVLTPEAIMELATGVPIIENFAADAESIAPGATLVLSWEVGAFDTLEIADGATVVSVSLDTVNGEGSIEVMPTENTTYTLTGTLNGGSQSREIFVLVGEAPIINEFALVGSDVVLLGESVDLIWNTFGETSLRIDPMPGDVTGMTETTVTPVAETVYTLSATNAFGTTTAGVTVQIREGGLVAHYNFSTEPSPTLIDESRGGTNGIDITFGLTSPTWLADDAGRTGVLSFDDTAGGVIRLLSPPTAPFPAGGFTVMLWAKSDQPLQTQYGTLFANGNGATNHFQIDADGTGNWRIRDSSSVNTPIGPIVEEWTHLALTWDGSSRVLYYNGLPVGAPSAVNPGSTFDEYRLGFNRANDANGPVDAEIDDLRIYDFALTADGVLAAMNASGGPGVGLEIENSGEDLVFSWDSKGGRVYDILTSVDLTGDPTTWPVWQGDLPATAPRNVETFARPSGPGEEKRFFVVVEKIAPPLFFDDFETDQGWVTGVDDANGNTAWERGTPSIAGPFLPFSGQNCFGTNIAANYFDEADIYLRSPMIDLTGGLTGAKLKIRSYVDTDLIGDVGSIRVLRFGDGVQLGADLAVNIEGIGADFAAESYGLPPEAIGEMVRIEFRFVSNNDAQNFAGWYLDDVEVSGE